MDQARNTIFLRKILLTFFASFFVLFQAQANFNETNVINQLRVLYLSDGKMYPSIQSKVLSHTSCDYYQALDYSSTFPSSNSYDSIGDLKVEWIFSLGESGKPEAQEGVFFPEQAEHEEADVSFKEVRRPPKPLPYYPSPDEEGDVGETLVSQRENGEAFKEVRRPPKPLPYYPDPDEEGDVEETLVSQSEHEEADVSFREVRRPPKPLPYYEVDNEWLHYPRSFSSSYFSEGQHKIPCIDIKSTALD